MSGLSSPIRCRHETQCLSVRDATPGSSGEHSVKAPRFRLSFRALATLDQVEEPRLRDGATIVGDEHGHTGPIIPPGFFLGQRSMS